MDVASIHSSLSFNAGTLIFNSAPASKDVFLQNKSITEEQYFSIQVGGGYARHVSVHPAIGIIPPGETKPIKIIFKPRPDDVRRQHELSGFLRVWSKEGFPLERYKKNQLLYSTTSHIIPFVIHTKKNIL